MQHPYALAVHTAQSFCLTLTGGLLALLSLLPLAAARAQSPAWAAASGLSISTQSGGTSQQEATAVDASGNVFVTGYFTGQVAFGSTVLRSAGSSDLFVAKYVPATGTWAWAQSGGGTGIDSGYDVAVIGTSVYVTGNIENNTADANLVRFGGSGTTAGTVVQRGASTNSSRDLVVAKYTDNGASATLGWTLVGGGFGEDIGIGIAVSGTSVYVTGVISSNTDDYGMVRFGGSGATAGTVSQPGAGVTPGSIGSDLVVAKYTDNGASATLGWTLVGGGAGSDQGTGIAVSGTSVYVTGSIDNNIFDAKQVRFRGSSYRVGTAVQLGASSTIINAATTTSNDLVVAKYTDNGASATLGWTHVGGGRGADRGNGIAVSGTSVYVTGSINNNTADANLVRFGGSGTTAGTVSQPGAGVTPGSVGSDLVVAKYTDNGASATLGWTHVGGGTDHDQGVGIAVSGTSVYVTGYIHNNTADANLVRFGGSGTTAGTVVQRGASTNSSRDLVVAKYTDNGASATLGWTQVGGGAGSDQGTGIAISGQNVLVSGLVTPSASFGSFTVATPVGDITTVLARLVDTSLLTLRVTSFETTGPHSLSLAPNPARITTLIGAQAGATVQVFDALGRLVLNATADDAGSSRLVLPAGLPAGVYLVRTGTRAVRLAVE